MSGIFSRVLPGPVACLLTAVAALLLACGEEPPPEPVRPVVSKVVGGPDELGGRWWPGRAKATQEVDLGFEVSGQLEERLVVVGDEVKAGDVLARLDPRDYENLLLRAQAERERAKAFFDRVNEAARTGAVARQDVDDARARFNQADAQVSIRQKAVDDARIVAPFDGLVSATYVDNFQNVRVKQPVIRLLDVSLLEMIINIPEQLINYSPYVKDIHVRFDAIEGVEIPAHIKEIGREASQATRTFPVTLIFDPRAVGADVQPGMAGQATGRVDAPERVAEGSVVVPAAAVFTPDGEESQDSYVWIVDEEKGIVTRRRVEPIRINEQGGSLVRGVEPGERVVTAGVHRLREGQQVLVP